MRPLVLVALLLSSSTAARADPEVGTGLGRFLMTFYWVAEERETRGQPNTYVYDTQCLPVAGISVAYLRQLAMEGTGLLVDGRLLNFAGRCACSWSGTACFAEVRDGRRWGVGVDDRPLRPFRSVAVDNALVPTGTRLYIADLDGLVMPGEPPAGGWTHDGCVVADDRGSAIQGAQLDFFVGRRAHYKDLDRLFRRNEVRVYEGGSRCP